MSEKHHIFGIHSVVALLNKNPKRILQLFLLDARQDPKIVSIMKLAKEHRIPL